MTTFNPEALSFDPLLIAPPTAWDIKQMRASFRTRAASDPGPLPGDKPHGPDMMQEPSWNSGRMLDSFQEDSEFVVDPPPAPMIYPEPEHMHDGMCDPTFCYPNEYCLPPPALTMEPINEVVSAPQPFVSNTMFGYDPNTPFPVPGPTHFIMERVFDRMYVDNITYPGFIVLANDADQEHVQDDEYVVFGLNDPSECTDFGRAMAAKHSMPRLDSVCDLQEVSATLDGVEWDLEAQQYQYQGHEFYCENTDDETYGTDYFDSGMVVPAMESTLDPEAPHFEASAEAIESTLDPEAPEFDTDVEAIALPGVRTPSPRLRLAMRPLMMRAKRLNISEDDLAWSHQLGESEKLVARV